MRTKVDIKHNCIVHRGTSTQGTSSLLCTVLYTLQTLKAEKTIAQLEADEEQLIEKLKQTQLQQRKAYDALQSSLAA
jgi:hypothetical protein